MDIGIKWDAATGMGDWAATVGDLVTASSIESAVFVSLFSDRRAPDDYRPNDGTNDPRGWWGSSFADRQLGSRLWTLDRAKKVGQTPLLLQARDYCKEALAWMIEDGIAAKIDVRTSWINATAIGIRITITEPTGTVLHPFQFSWAWN
ncbi:phage GP46 family protein [Roseicella sp. DB1501]|uniref:phage GP46 family protein n=1 Tax=Roseicella sp. DB1501 TaxID=2730925 RepID=UPI001491CFE7|nr:phage GP46 family protein [Roseicella sp. DB1501]NOG69821.1 phage GP46 family protein [Roseicella sp. DB1501]